MGLYETPSWAVGPCHESGFLQCPYLASTTVTAQRAPPQRDTPSSEFVARARFAVNMISARDVERQPKFVV